MGRKERRRRQSDTMTEKRLVVRAREREWECDGAWGDHGGKFNDNFPSDLGGRKERAKARRRQHDGNTEDEEAR